MSKKPSQQQGRSRISCTVDNSVLGALVQILADHRVSGIRVEPVDDGPVFSDAVMSTATRESLGDRRKRPHSQVTPTRETRLGSLVLSILRASEEPMTSVEVGREIEKHSYKPQSASPCLSELEKEKAVLCDKSVRQRYLYSLAAE